MAQKSLKKKTGNRKPQQETKPREYGIAVILLLTFIAFFPSLKDGFVNWDDHQYLLENPITKDLSWHNIKHIFNAGTFVMGNYHPLTIFTYCLEYHYFKLDPFIYHLDNVLLHLVNVLLVY